MYWMYKEHFLSKRVRDFKIPKCIVFYDTESQACEEVHNKGMVFLQHRPVLIVYRVCIFLNNNELIDSHYGYFDEADGPDKLVELVTSLAEEHRTVYVMSHNLHFDYNIIGFTQKLADAGYVIKTNFVDSKLFYRTFASKKKRLVFMDSFNFIKVGIAEMGKTVGLQKLDMPAVEDKKKMLEYCKRDVEILSSFVIHLFNFFLEHGSGIGITLPSVAFNTFRKNFLAHSVYIHKNRFASVNERRSYFGGRTEMYYKGKVKDVIELDVNSLYPYVMRENYFPTKYLGWMVASEQLIEKLMKTRLLLLRVIVNVPKDVKRTLIPFRTSTYTIYPTGRFETTITDAEYRIAKERGWIEKVKYIFIYKKEKIFREYIDYFYELKKKYKDNNPVYYEITKLMLNSLSGKWGQRVIEQHKVYLNENEANDLFNCDYFVDVKKDGSKKVYSVGRDETGVFLSYKTTENAYNSFVAISSFITAYARCHMFKFLESMDVLYTDTDSLFITYSEFKRNEDRLPVGSELGQFKIEARFKWVNFKGAKHYITPKFRKCKGIGKKDEEVEPNVFKCLHFLKTPSLATRKLEEGVYQYYTYKKLTEEYRKGKIVGKHTVIPYDVSELPEKIFKKNYNIRGIYVSL